jgi:hypothetical protein
MDINEPPDLSTARAFALAARGDLPAAIAAAVRAVRRAPDPDLLAALARWRVQAYAEMAHPPGRAAWPPNLADPFPHHIGVPVLAAADLTADALGGAILHHGSLRVNGLLSPAAAESLRLGIDRALQAQLAAAAGEPETDPGWYVKLDHPDLNGGRIFVEESGEGMWTADSPAMLQMVIDALIGCGVIGHIEAYMGERPALSVAKSTLRRVSFRSRMTPLGPHPSENSPWHQDGAFLGRDTRAVNVWVALSHCGVDAPGLDVVATRVPYIVQTNSHGAILDWTVGDGLVRILAERGAPIESPVFAPGDALLFDQMMLHRTGLRDGMTRNRWALETWFFAPTHYPLDRVPLLV